MTNEDFEALEACRALAESDEHDDAALATFELWLAKAVARSMGRPEVLSVSEHHGRENDRLRAEIAARRVAKEVTP